VARVSVEQHNNLAWSAPARVAGTPDILHQCCALLRVSAVLVVRFVGH